MKFYLQLFWSFFKIGCFTFGGGFAMIPLIQREIREKRGWITEDEFVELLALAQTSPGPVSLNTSVFVGYRTRGLAGSIVALLGTVIPSFVIILVIAMFFVDLRDYPLIDKAFKGMRPAVVALIASPVYNLAKRMEIKKIILAAAVAVTIGFLGVSPIYFLIAGAAGGILYGIYGKD